MKKIVTSIIVASTALAAMALSVVPAAADIVCNREDVCWHTREHYAFRPEHAVFVHPDNWRPGPRDPRYVWREHEGRGYWRQGVWIVF